LFRNYYLIIILIKQSPAAHQVYLPAGRHPSTHSMQHTEEAVGQMASKFAEYKLNGLIGGLLQAYNKTENNRQNQESTSGYLGQPDTRTDRQGCERLLKLSD